MFYLFIPRESLYYLEVHNDKGKFFKTWSLNSIDLDWSTNFNFVVVRSPLYRWGKNLFSICRWEKSIYFLPYLWVQKTTSSENVNWGYKIINNEKNRVYHMKKMWNTLQHEENLYMIKIMQNDIDDNVKICLTDFQNRKYVGSRYCKKRCCSNSFKYVM